MADRENWENELGACGRDEQELSDESAETGTPEKSAACPEPSSGNREHTTGDTESTLVKENNQEIPNRARKAQRTRRVRLNNQQGFGSPTIQPGPLGQTNSMVELDPSPNLSKMTNTPTGTIQNNPKPRVNPTLGKPTPEPTATPPSTPITIPPQVTGFQNETGVGFDSQQEDEPSRILAGLCCLAEGLVSAFKTTWQMLKGLLSSTKVIPFPALCGALIYVGVIYLVGTYIFNAKEVSHLDGFEKSFKFTLVSAGWVMLPLFSAFVVIHFDTRGTKHHQFLYESLLDAVLQMFNSVIMTAHAGPESLVWLGPIFLVSAVFRLLYWLSLFYFGQKWNQIFKTPAVVNSIVLSAFNIGASLRHYADGLSSGIPDRDTSATDAPSEVTSETSGPGWF